MTTNATDIERLEGLMGKLPEGSQGFAGDLCRKFRENGVLTWRQWEWIPKLIDRAENFSKEPEVENVGAFTRVHELLTKAREHLKYPKIRLVTEDGNNVALQLPGERSRYYGKVGVTDGGRYGENKWYGAISASGEWELPRMNGVPQSVKDLVQALANDPEKVASEYGKLTGNCCFCGAQLSDGRSTEVGYGPVCARNFFMPWGKH